MANKQKNFTPNFAGGGVPRLPVAERNRTKEERRIALVVEVDRAITSRDYTALVRLERECEGLQILKKIKKALND